MGIFLPPLRSAPRLGGCVKRAYGPSLWHRQRALKRTDVLPVEVPRGAGRKSASLFFEDPKGTRLGACSQAARAPGLIVERGQRATRALRVDIGPDQGHPQRGPPPLSALAVGGL